MPLGVQKCAVNGRTVEFVATKLTIPAAPIFGVQTRNSLSISAMSSASSGDESELMAEALGFGSALGLALADGVVGAGVTALEDVPAVGGGNGTSVAVVAPAGSPSLSLPEELEDDDESLLSVALALPVTVVGYVRLFVKRSSRWLRMSKAML